MIKLQGVLTMDVIELIAAYFKPKKQQREWRLTNNVVISVRPNKDLKP